MITMLVRIRYLVLAVALFAIAALVSGCEKKQAEPERAVFELCTPDFLDPDLKENGVYVRDDYFVLLYNKEGKTLLEDETEVAIELYSGGRMWFFVNTDMYPNGTYQYISETITNAVEGKNHDIVFDSSLPLSDRDDSSYYSRIGLYFPSSGDYVFRLRFTQKDLIFFTPLYRLPVEIESRWIESIGLYVGYYMFSPIEKIEEY